MIPSAEMKASPAWVRSALDHADVELRTLRQEKKGSTPHPEVLLGISPRWKMIEGVVGNSPAEPYREAWWTCPACPQPYRWWVNEHYDEGYEVIPGSEWDREHGNENEFYDSKNSRWMTVKRCKRCARMRGRHHRAKKNLRKTLVLQIEHMGTSARFVTLTVPNEVILLVGGLVPTRALGDLVRSLKKKVAAFSRTVAYGEKVIGSVEFYEQTYTVSETAVEVNTHVHCVWLGQYWPQGDLQSRWGHIVEISKPHSERAVMKYISKYVTKDDIVGVRCSETRGVLRKPKATQELPSNA